jgi:hypothetical protein
MLIAYEFEDQQDKAGENTDDAPVLGEHESMLAIRPFGVFA